MKTKVQIIPSKKKKIDFNIKALYNFNDVSKQSQSM